MNLGLIAKMATSKAVKEAIIKRSEGMCERCGGVGCDPHHLLEGSTKSQTECAENVLWVCRSCHRYLHSAQGQKENHGYKLDYQAWLLKEYDLIETRKIMGDKMMLDENDNIPLNREPFWLKEEE